jgi:hypothetical protein
LSLGAASERLPQTLVIVFGIAVIGVLFLAGPWLMNRWFLALVALLSGATFSWIGIAQTSILQTRVGLEIQGRIFATREFFSNVTLILTTFGIGLVSLMTALKSLLLVVGAALLVIAGFGLWLARRLEQQ